MGEFIVKLEQVADLLTAVNDFNMGEFIVKLEPIKIYLISSTILTWGNL